MIEAYLKMLETGYYEVTFAFDGLADEHVWKRPAEGLLSVGELAGHIAYWEAVRFAGGGADLTGHSAIDLTQCRVSSPLIDHRFRYYSTTLENPPSEQHLAMTAEQVCQELLRVHKEAIADLKARNPELNDTNAAFLEYASFHIAYHTGQMYTVRHLLGEKTPDN